MSQDSICSHLLECADLTRRTFKHLSVLKLRLSHYIFLVLFVGHVTAKLFELPPIWCFVPVFVQSYPALVSPVGKEGVGPLRKHHLFKYIETFTSKN